MYFHFKFLEKNNGIQTQRIKALKHTFIKWNHEKDFILKVRIPQEICLADQQSILFMICFRSKEQCREEQLQLFLIPQIILKPQQR